MAGFVALFLSGCNAVSLFEGEAAGYVSAFGGGVAGDEPTSVLVAREILAGNGSAVDAVVAAYFAMAVTLPSAASLGGGGVCLVTDKEKQKTESLLFLSGGRDGNGPALPVNVRAMFALHAKYGQLPWRRLVAPSENLARFGMTVSRAFARDLDAARAHIQASPVMSRIFANQNGTPAREGEKLRQPDLAATLSLIRRRPAGFFTGKGAARLARAYSAAGVTVSTADIDRARPAWRAPITVRRGNQAADFPPTPAGLVAAQAWAILYRDGAFASAGKAERPHLIAETSRRVNADAGRWLWSPAGVDEAAGALIAEKRTASLMADYTGRRKTGFRLADGDPRPAPVDQGAASVIAVDQFGQAVACNFTMNGLMGMVRVAPGTGIIMAAPPAPGVRGTSSSTLMLLRLHSQNQLEYMAAATGGPAAPMVLVSVGLRAMAEKLNLEAASKATRIFAPAIPDHVLVEGDDASLAVNPGAGLSRRGHRVVPSPALGRINGLLCPAGFEGNKSKCELRTDRRGFGFVSHL